MRGPPLSRLPFPSFPAVWPTLALLLSTVSAPACSPSQVCHCQTGAADFAVGHAVSLRSSNATADEEDKRIIGPSAPFKPPKKKARRRPAGPQNIESSEPPPGPPQPVKIRRARPPGPCRDARAHL